MLEDNSILFLRFYLMRKLHVKQLCNDVNNNNNNNSYFIRLQTQKCVLIIKKRAFTFTVLSLLYSSNFYVRNHYYADYALLL